MTDPDDDLFAAQSLSALPRVEPSRDLLRRVAQIPIEHPRQNERLGIRQWAFGLLAAALLGLAAGWVTLSGDDMQQTVSPIAVMPGSDSEILGEQADDATQSESDAELEGMLALALGDDPTLDDEL